MTSTINAGLAHKGRLTVVLFSSTIFLSASLLFFVQPLFAKIVLPLIGGAPAVWTTAMLFFQTVLIVGYLYAHLSAKYLPVAAQVGVHLVLWAIALTFLPLSVQQGWRFDPTGSVATQTLLLFALGVGAPFAVLSANAPLIQSWYSRSGGPSADDPYFLYGASNLGSLGALLAFPLVAEPLFGAEQIGWGWAVGFVALGAFLALSGFAARKGNAGIAEPVTVARPQLKQFAWWLLLAFIPSSLMLSVTTKISTDLGSFPLIWVLPLSLYLMTFVLAFTNKPLLLSAALSWPLVVSICVFAMMFSGIKLGSVSIPMTAALLVAFFFIAVKSHRALYEARPEKQNLTIFYLTMSVGGALGGLFNSLIAPNLFSDLHEARITIFLAAVLIFVGAPRPKLRDWSTGSLAAGIVALPVVGYGFFGERLGIDALVLTMGILLLISLFVFRNGAAQRFLCTSVVLVIGLVLTNVDSQFKDRSFFGTHLVRDDDQVRIYTNGTTVHGAQNIADLATNLRPTPLYYYHPMGPMAQVLTSNRVRGGVDIGIVGLGVGSLACYGVPGQKWQFYEIDTMVDQVARDPSLFTFVSHCAPNAPTHIGDARVVLRQQADVQYDVLVIDAYSSDAVPVHLTTIEALALYRDRVKPGGIIMFHISNRYYDISRPLGRSAEALGLTARIQDYRGDPDDSTNSPSTVVIMSDKLQSLATFSADDNWEELTSDGGRIWTDDYANLLSILD